MLNICYPTNMAAPASVFRTAMKGVQLHGQWLNSQTPTLFPCLRPLQGSIFRCNSSAEPERNSRAHGVADPATQSRTSAAEDELDDHVYIPQKKARNPMRKIGYAWMIGLPAGIIGFLLAKREVDKNRLKQLKIRQRMRMSNEGEYGGSRYNQSRDVVKVD
ncbi:DUF4748 domain-containing protein [Synchiropus splendidus]|uniref:DUF4748 domain-containing protein n=1 Tax=Synchiropus splendidus TaxID=270530 RepID=UPI00237E6BA0|nr:DUF4748 domain-containing protein [Synchiropus splendidus]